MKHRVDTQGRITLPKMYRQRMGMLKGDTIELTVEGDFVKTGRKVRRCAICGELDES